MRRGLIGAGDGLLLIKLNKNNNYNYPLGEKQEQGKGLARQGWTGQDKAGYIQGETMTNWHRTANTRRI